MDDLVKLNKRFFIIEILAFNVLGVFGNTNLIYATLRKKEMRTKPGLLLTTTAACHIVCLLSELINATFVALDRPVVRRNCERLMIPYMFFICAQVAMTLMMALDLLAAVGGVSGKIYEIRRGVICLWACIVPTLYGLVELGCAVVYTDDSIIDYCNPPLALIPSISRLWSLSNVVINTAIVAVYISVIIVVKIRGRKSVANEQRRVIRRLIVVAVVFVCSWYVTMLGVDIANLFPEKIRIFWQSNMVSFALICYSQTFYVCLWRSLEYRKLFLEQISWIFLSCICKARKQTHSDRSMGKKSNNITSKNVSIV